MGKQDDNGEEGRDVQLARLVLSLRAQGVSDPAVLAALESTPRELFTRTFSRKGLSRIRPCRSPAARRSANRSSSA